MLINSQNDIENMKLQRNLNRKVGGKRYDRYEISIPSKSVRKAGFHTGMNLKTSVKKHKLTLSG